MASKPTVASVKEELDEVTLGLESFMTDANSALEALIARVNKLEGERVINVNVQGATQAPGRPTNPRGEDNLTDNQRTRLRNIYTELVQAGHINLASQLHERVTELSNTEVENAAVNKWVGQVIATSQSIAQGVQVSGIPALPTSNEAPSVPSPTDDIPF